MSTHQVLSQFDTSKFRWKPIYNGNKPESYCRALCGAELYQEFWLRLARGEQILFFGSYIHIPNSVPRKWLIDATRQSWISLRYQIPTIAASTYVADNGEYRLAYTPPKSRDDVTHWAGRTLIVSTSKEEDTIGLDKLREELAQAEVPSPEGDQTWLHLVLPSSTNGNDEVISDFGLLIHTSHTPFDGIGLRILSNRFLKLLANELTSHSNSHSKLEWGKEVDNLLPATMSILDPSEPRPISPTSKDEPSFNLPYYSSLARVIEGFGASMQNPYGFRSHDKDSGRPLTRRINRTFTRAESQTILRHLKPRSTARYTSQRRGYTVAQLAHAALAMLVAFNNPPSPDCSSLAIHNIGLVNSRYLLKPPYSSREGYPGYALGVTMLSIPVSLFLSKDSGDKGTLIRVLQYTRGIYEEQKRNEGGGLLSNMPQLAEITGKPLREAWEKDQVPPNQNFSFSSDGKGESYLDSEFFDEKGSKILELTNFWTSLNRIDPGPFVRISSWKGILDISADYNANVVSKEEVEEMMDKWKEFIMLIEKLDEREY